VQIGTQRRSTPHLIEARDEIVRAGKLGRVGHVETYGYFPMTGGRSPREVPPPPTLDYEMWTGPAPMRPYNELLHPKGWRAFMEYGNGTIGDIGIHMLDMVRWMLGLGAPRLISSAGGIFVEPGAAVNIADNQTATFDFGDLRVLWTHRFWGAPPDPDDLWGATFYGEKGTLKANVWRYEFAPLGGTPVRRPVTLEFDKFPEDREEPELEDFAAPAIRAHMKNLLECRQTRSRPVADIEEGHVSTSACILANLSMKLRRTLEWDAVKGMVEGDDEANRLLRRPYRAPWVHPEPATA
jgi:predicted dehydrogenase